MNKKIRNFFKDVDHSREPEEIIISSMQREPRKIEVLANFHAKQARIEGYDITDLEMAEAIAEVVSS